MKKRLRNVPTLIVILLLLSLGLHAQTYHEDDVEALEFIRDNNFTDDNLLEWTDEDPGNWLGVEWNDDNPKRVIQISLRKDGTDGNGNNENNDSWPVSFDFDTKFDGYIASGVNSALDGVVDFSAFEALKILNLRRQDEITAINVQGLDNLQYFAFTYSNLTKLDLSNLPSLIEARMTRSALLDSLDISNCPSLIKVKAAWDTYNLTYVNVQGSTSLRHLNLKQHNLTSLDVSGLTQLNKLAVSDGSIETLVGTEDLSSLFALCISKNDINGSYNVSNFDYNNLYKFSLQDNEIDEIVGLETVLAMDEIYNLNAGNNNLTLTDIVHIDNFEGDVGNNLNSNGTDQTRYGDDYYFVPASLDYSDEALITVDGVDVATTFTLYTEADEVVETNTTGLFDFETDENAGKHYVTMVNSGVTLTTNMTSILEEDAAIIETDVSQLDFEIFVNQSISQTFTIENTGRGDLVITDIVLPEWYTIDLTAAVIESGDDQDFIVTYTPFEVGEYEGTLSVISNAGFGNDEINLMGTSVAIGPIISLDIVQDFGAILTDASVVQTLNIENGGGETLDVTDIVLPDGFSINATTASINVRSNQDFDVTFTPTEVGFYAGSINVVNDAVEGNSSIAVSGIGLQSDSYINLVLESAFTAVSAGNSQQRDLEVTNLGLADFEITNIEVPTGYSIDATTAIIEGAETVSFPIVFTPTSESTFSGDIVVTNDASAGVSTVAVSGEGIESALIASLSTAFGSLSVGNSENQTLTITNDYDVAIDVSDITLPEGFTISKTTATLRANTSKSFTVTFDPLEAGTFSGDIVITSDASTDTNTISISGEAVSSALTASLADFGDVTLGESETQQLTVSNTSGATIEISDITVPSGFSIDSSSATLLDGESEDFTVTFSPTEEKTYSGDILITSDATQTELTVAVSGSAIPVLDVNDDLIGINIYPNPTTDGIIHVTGITKNMSLSIYSLAGHLVKQVELSAEKNQIDISDLLQGMYIIRSNNREIHQAIVRN